jgi:predicted tellurium resistance membrane protein TerC
LALVAVILMMFEATVFLAYYKDIMFAMITLLNYIGIYMNLEERHDLDYFKKVLISFMSVISVFISVTFLHDFDKVFYRQYSKFYGKYQQNRIIMLNTPKKKNQKKSNFEL